jgi:hypothetical protein
MVVLALAFCGLEWGAGAAESRGRLSASGAAPAHVEFLRDIAPILDKSGCSGAQCHGKFGGRGGFQLSLLTLSPEDDYAPIVYGGRGRRVNFAFPEKSLLLLKATNQIDHGGGIRFDVHSPEYATLLRWIRQGAPFQPTDPRVVSYVLKPNKARLAKVGDKLPIRAWATYTDGTVRDVTKQTVFQSTNSAVLDVSPEGVVSGGRWGGGAILGRYLGTIAASFVTLPQARQGKYPTVPENNLIDHAVFSNLRALNVLPSLPCSDLEFLRRVTLDTLGRLPTQDEMKAFLADTHPDRRAREIDLLLARPEFSDFRALRLADLLRVNPQKLSNSQLGDRSGELFYEWIWNRAQENTPWNEFVRQVITARGSCYQVGPANFYRVERAANDRMENIGQAFLGVRMSCARCHKHPFDRWTTDDYWNFAAFTQKVSERGGRLYDEGIIGYDPNAQLVNQSVLGKNRGRVAPPTYLGGGAPTKDQPDTIVALADWITDPHNPFFARATMNRLWSYYFAKGIIEPVDDMRATSPEAVPGLLDALAAEFVRNHYDVKAMIRLMLNSRVYQLSAIPNRTNRQDDRFFSHFIPRPMPAQVLLDMLNQASGSGERFGAFPERARAVQASFPIGNSFLDAFGQSHRAFLTDLNPKLDPNLVQTLTMINSPYVEDKIRNGSTLNEVVKASTSEADLVRECYLRTFNRPPHPAEIDKAAALLKQAKDRREGAQDLLWALLTSREFYFNH